MYYEAGKRENAKLNEIFNNVNIYLRTLKQPGNLILDTYFAYFLIFGIDIKWRTYVIIAY